MGFQKNTFKLLQRVFLTKKKLGRNQAKGKSLRHYSLAVIRTDWVVLLQI